MPSRSYEHMAVTHEMTGHDQYSKKQNASAKILFCDSAYAPPIFIIMRRAIFIDCTSVRAKAFAILDPAWSISDMVQKSSPSCCVEAAGNDLVRALKTHLYRGIPS